MIKLSTMNKLGKSILSSGSAQSLNIISRKYHFIVVGGGVSGLSAAQTIIDNCKVPCKVTLTEATSRVGGWLRTVRDEDGSVFETGPRILRPSGIQGQNTLRLVENLGLGDKIIPVLGDNPTASKRFIYGKGKINELRTSPVSAMFAQPPLSKSLLSAILKEPFQPKSDKDDESVHEYFSRRLGVEVADYLSDALCRGVYASKAKELSVKACFRMLWDYEKKHGSLVKGALFTKTDKVPDDVSLYNKAVKEKWQLWTLEGGLQTITETWHESLLKNGVEIMTDQPCAKVEFTDDNRKITCHLKDKKLEGDYLISTIPATPLASMLSTSDSVITGSLNSIPYVTVAVVNMEFDEELLQYDGFGFLVPSCENLKILGVIFESCLYRDPIRPRTKLTVMMGGSDYEKHFGNPDTPNIEYIKKVAVETAMKELQIKKEPVKVITTVNRKCMAQYQPGHVELVSDIRSYISKSNLPLTIAGAGFDGAGINDCIYNSKMRVLEMLSRFNI